MPTNPKTKPIAALNPSPNPDDFEQTDNRYHIYYHYPEGLGPTIVYNTFVVNSHVTGNPLSTAQVSPQECQPAAQTAQPVAIILDQPTESSVVEPQTLSQPTSTVKQRDVVKKSNKATQQPGDTEDEYQYIEADAGYASETCDEGPPSPRSVSYPPKKKQGKDPKNSPTKNTKNKDASEDAHQDGANTKKRNASTDPEAEGIIAKKKATERTERRDSLRSSGKRSAEK